MFLEQAFTSSGRRGWIEIITGSMFSGKTEELIRRLRRASLARQQVEIFKPQVDDRYDPNRVVSHDANAIPSRAVTSSSDILTFSEKMDVIGIDEVQFFDKKITSVCNELANRGIRVVVAGLDMDYRGMPFAPVSDLMAIAEYVTKLHAICIRCGHLAHHSHRTTEENARVVLGEKNKYEPLCRDCFNKRQASDL